MGVNIWLTRLVIAGSYVGDADDRVVTGTFSSGEGVLLLDLGCLLSHKQRSWKLTSSLSMNGSLSLCDLELALTSIA